MTTELFVRRSRLDASAEEVFRWHARPGAFERYNPPWDPVEVVERSGGITDGGRTVVRVKLGPLRRRWVAMHRDYVEGRQFRDVQEEGPFARFEHLHLVEPDGPEHSYLEDRIEYTLPLGPLGQLLGGGLARRKLEQTFAYRHQTLKNDLAAHARYSGPPLRVLVSGASGLLGNSLVPFLTTGGHQVTRLVRSSGPAAEPTIPWDPAAGRLEAAALEGLDAVVHLAGESIAAGRWTAARKARILESRVQGTRLLCETLARLERPPRVLVSASAVGYYGDRGDEVLTEESSPGRGFLADVCRAWEEATEEAERKGIRVVRLRFGVILSPTGGALAKMLPPFRAGGGGVLGSGRQYLSWIALDDALGAVHHALISDAVRGPVNVVSPNPVTNREFTKTLGRVLVRPTFVPLPAFAARLLLGEMADELLLASTRALPARLTATGYPFRHPQLEDALRHLLGKTTTVAGSASDRTKPH